jgi:hypothetical protein
MPARPNTYDVGDLVVLTGSFVNKDAVPTNPTTVVLKVREPDGVVVTVSAPSTGVTGVYEGTFPPTKVGTHWYRFLGTGTVSAAGETAFVVRKQQVV